MSDPNLLTIFSVVFLFLAIYNVYSGIKRMREAQRRGQPVRWYKQINMLIGIEYTLLSLVFLLTLDFRNGTLPKSFQGIVAPFYLIVLLSSAILAGFVIRQAFLNGRRPRQSATAQAQANGKIIVNNKETTNEALTSEQQALNVQRQRERRRKAAAARRRRNGKS